MLRLLNVATPAMAATLAVPDSVPAPGLFPMAIRTVSTAVRITFPSASRSETSIAGAMATPATTVLGGTSNTSCVGVDGITSKVALVADVRPVAVATSV